MQPRRLALPPPQFTAKLNTSVHHVCLSSQDQCEGRASYWCTSSRANIEKLCPLYLSHTQGIRFPFVRATCAVLEPTHREAAASLQRSAGWRREVHDTYIQSHGERDATLLRNDRPLPQVYSQAPSLVLPRDKTCRRPWGLSLV